MRQNGCGNDGLWTPRKTKGRFPTGVHSPWKSQKAAIPTFPQLRRGAEKWKTKSRFPTFPLAVFSSPKTNQKGGLAADRFAPAFRLILGLENAGMNRRCRRTVTTYTGGDIVGIC